MKTPLHITQTMMETRDVFICHAGLDKEEYVRPFVQALCKKAITYWLDEAEITWGDKITKKINSGLAISKYVIVFLSESFLEGNWPQAELESALNRESSTGEVIVLPLLIAPAEVVFRQYPLLRDKHYLKWDEGADSIATKLSVRLNREFKKEWVHCHPAGYTGKVWIRILTNPESVASSHNFVVRWGPLKLEKTIDLRGHQTVSLVHAKGDDGLSIPIFFSVTPACYASFGQGDPLDDYVIDINHGWIRTDAT
jgi:hypothetical protein